MTEPADCQRFDQLLDQQHFLGPRAPSGNHLRQVLTRDGQWVALLLWCSSALCLKDRDDFIGWDPLTRAQRLKLIVNNARFLVLDEARHPNLASQALAAAVAALPGQWLARFGYRPLLAETFTDPEAHAGTCYKAAGWQPVGMSAGFQRNHRCDYFLHHGRPKRIWLRPLHPRALQWLCAAHLPADCQAALTEGAGARCALNAPQQRSLVELFRPMPDPRRRQGRRFPLPAVLTLIALALLGGAQSVSDIHRTAQRLSPVQRRSIGLRPKKGTRFYPVPGYDLYRDVLAALDLEAFARLLTGWLQARAGLLPRTLALDGKTIRENLGCIISLVDQEDGVPVALAAAPHKGHELKAAQSLLADEQVLLTGAVVSADALHCQQHTAQIITQQKGGDYLLAVKANQPTLAARA
ncbi:MAG: ISAs1 family transposase, partial [Rubrivivax sp.]|nr:ISAs1 family transposase [Rubrivivax sp.]